MGEISHQDRRINVTYFLKKCQNFIVMLFFISRILQRQRRSNYIKAKPVTWLALIAIGELLTVTTKHLRRCQMGTYNGSHTIYLQSQQSENTTSVIISITLTVAFKYPWY